MRLHASIGAVPFDLLTSPFAVLGLSGDASTGSVVSRARELGNAEAISASRTLLIPRMRLHAELSFLPGASEGVVHASCNALRKGGEPDLGALTPLARANVLAHLASHRTARAAHLRDLAGLQDAIRSTTDGILCAAREHAGMPSVPGERLEAALETISGQHAEAFAEGMLALPTGAHLFTEQLQASGANASAQASFLRLSAAAWDRATASEAAQDLECAALIETTLKNHPNSELANQLALVVVRFANRTKPPREACRLVGLPHEPSAEAAHRWRAVALDLNNRQNAILEAATVLEAVVDGFGKTDECGISAAGDLEICRERLASGEGTPEVRRLVAAIEAAAEQELAFQRSEIADGRTTARTPAVVADLFCAFVAATRTARSDLPWRLLRAFTLRLHNEFSATAAALSFTQLAIRQGTGKAIASDAIRQLQVDLRILRKEQLTIELGAALRASQKTVARRLLTEILTLIDDGEERHEFQAALQRLNQQQTTARIKYGVYAAIGLAVVLFLANSNNSNLTTPTSVIPPTVDPDVGRQLPPFDPDVAPANPPPAPTAPPFSPPASREPSGNVAYAQGQADR